MFACCKWSKRFRLRLCAVFGEFRCVILCFWLLSSSLLTYSDINSLLLIIYLQHSPSRFSDSVWGVSCRFQYENKHMQRDGRVRQKLQLKADSGKTEGEKARKRKAP